MNLIFAVSQNNVIGVDNKMPWHIPEDLKYFKNITTDNVIIMGRKTFESIGNKPLKNRINIVLSCSLEQKIEENLYIIRMEDLDDILSRFSNKKIFVIGGVEIINLLIRRCTKVFLTYVYKEYLDGIKVDYSLDYFKENYRLSSESMINNYQFLKYKFYIFEK